MNAPVDSQPTLAEQTERARHWASEAHDAGWLDPAGIERIEALSGATSADLFSGDAADPLVVALFGGTGVGKSSLLNRLVGSDVARVGVIRPTSLEATVYVHESVEFAGPAQSGFVRSVHEDDRRRHIVWVDMPDVDSTAAHNRELVLSFLPFVDVLIYVVSPERYRDEAPWSLLREQAERCAWVFVMNQMDRGQPAQLDDLGTALRNADFADPVVFATSCGAPSEHDQFSELAGFVDGLAEERMREALQEEGRRARLKLLGREVADLSARWPSDLSALDSAWEANQKGLAQELRDDLVERLAGVAARMAKGEAAAPGELWDDWASERLQDALTATQISAQEAGFPSAALKRFDTVIDDGLAARGEAALRESVRSSLAQPGNAFQRAIYSATQWLVFALPLAALAWVGWFVVSGFYGGATGEGAFVADGFALNAILLVALSAGVPWLLGRLLKPSPRKAADLGIRRGLDEVLDHIGSEFQTHRQVLVEELGRLNVLRDELMVTPESDATSSGLTQRLRRG